jgi:tripartite-type tricarboxylate transporter receptor subunit TctC
MFRASRTTGGPYILPPGTPKERADILREAVRKMFSDPGYQKEYKKLVGDDLAPVAGEDIEKAIRALQPSPETIELYKKIIGAGPLPPQ